MTRNAKTHERAMARASSYQEWYEAALAYDAHEGLGQWRQEKESDDYDYRLIASRVALIRKLRRQKDYEQLVFRLREELHGNLGNMANPALYSHARAGTASSAPARTRSQAIIVPRFGSRSTMTPSRSA